MAISPALDGNDDIRVDNYATLIDGKVTPLTQLTLLQALKALCDAYDLIEDLGDSVSGLNDRIEKWRNEG